MLWAVEFDHQARLVAKQIDLHAAESVKRDWQACVQLKTPRSTRQRLKAPVQKGLGCAASAIHSLHIRRRRARRINKQRRERRFDAVPDKPAYARRVVALPRWVDRQRNVGGPSRNRARRQGDSVSDAFISSASSIEHPR